VLIEFKFKNYLSFKHDQVLSFVPSSDKLLRETNLLTTSIKSYPELQKAILIYGPNGSGKSVLVQAFKSFTTLIRQANMIQPGQDMPVEPYLHDRANQKQPTEFEISGILKGLRFQYGIKATRQRVHEEYLKVYTTVKPQTWFHRRFDPKSNQDIYQLSVVLKGNRQLWCKSTRNNALYLSTAVNLNCHQLNPFFEWLTQHFLILDEACTFSPDVTNNLIRDFESREQIRLFMNYVLGTDCLAIDLVETGNRQQEALFHYPSKAGYQMKVLYRAQSAGFRRLYCLAGYIYQAIHNGKTLIIDDLDTNLHTLACRALVQYAMYKSQEGQFLMTTHDTELMDIGMLRRDQIWFTDIDPINGTRLYPLTDFSLRQNKALAKGYIEGEFGAIPLKVSHEI